LIILARTGKSLHKIAQAMCTLSLLFYRLWRGKTMPRFTGDNIRFTNATVKTLVVPAGENGKAMVDTEEPGFFIRKFKSGKATFGVKYVCLASNDGTTPWRTPAALALRTMPSAHHAGTRGAEQSREYAQAGRRHRCQGPDARDR